MIIEFERDKAFKRYLVGDAGRFLWKIVFIIGLNWLLKAWARNPEGEFADNVMFPISVGFANWLIIIISILAILQTCWSVYKSYCGSYKRVYEFEGDKHTKTITIITTRRTQARTQVVNNITISQGLIDKYFDLWTLTVEYGFSDEGYDFSYYNLSEDTALKLEKKIKSKGSNVKIK